MKGGRQMVGTSGLYFEDIKVGEDLPILQRGPMSAPHLMRWSSAIENWHRIHYDLPFTQGHEGLPGLLINGSWKQHFIVQMIRQWAEPTGWLSKVEFRFRELNVAGETLTAWGKVTGLRPGDAFGTVQLELGVVNESGREAAPGLAEVVFPKASGSEVPYPFVNS